MPYVLLDSSFIIGLHYDIKCSILEPSLAQVLNVANSELYVWFRVAKLLSVVVNVLACNVKLQLQH